MWVQTPTKHCVCKDIYIWNPSTCASEINRYLKSVAGSLVIAWGELIDTVAKLHDNVSDDLSINLNDKKATCEMVYFILYTILLVTILFLEIIIYYYFIKHQTKYWPKIKDLFSYY